jgi:predicted Zn-dependent peptidase
MRFARYRDVLPSGLRVVTVELPHLHSASVVMYAKVGSRYESERDNGLSHFLEHMLFRGTARLPGAFQLNDAIEGLGGTLHAETGRDYSLYQISLPPESLAGGIEMFGEIFSSPKFADIEVERRIILEEILEDLDDDGDLVNVDDIARQAVWPDHPLGFRITGPYENVKRFGDRDIARHFRRSYGARNMVLTVSGAVERRAVLEWAERAMRHIPPGSEVTSTPPDERQEAPRFVYVEHPGSQTSAQLLFRALDELAPEYPALTALSRIVDDGMSTRLHHRLCDDLGLAYYVSGSLDTYVDTALFEVDATAGHANVAALVRESLALLARLRDEPPSLAELEKAKRRYRWDLEKCFDDPDAMAGWWGGTELFHGPSPLEQKLERMERVTPEAVSAVARKIFRPERLTVACVGLLERGRGKEVRAAVNDFR